MNGRNPILCVGEVLWDAMPAGLFLGGAPHNVAFHLGRLGHPAAPVSRVGDDTLGREAIRRIEAAGLVGDFVQTDRELATGFVSVRLHEEGVPEYEIEQPAAWDAIALMGDVKDAATGAPAVVFGSLAQRSDVSRRTVQTLAGLTSTAVFDVNLRPPHVDRVVVDQSLQLADHVKLNEDELGRIARWSNWSDDPRSAVETLAGVYDCRLVCVTRGDRGALLWHEGSWHEHDGYEVEVRDTVGSGDAFLAALLAAVLDGRTNERALDLACRLGAYVATRDGATPDYRVDGVADLASLAL